MSRTTIVCVITLFSVVAALSCFAVRIAYDRGHDEAGDACERRIDAINAARWP